MGFGKKSIDLDTKYTTGQEVWVLFLNPFVGEYVPLKGTVKRFEKFVPIEGQENRWDKETWVYGVETDLGKKTWMELVLTEEEVFPTKKAADREIKKWKTKTTYRNTA